jgi:hypothetical protein
MYTLIIVGFPSQLQAALIVSIACATNEICRLEIALLRAGNLLGLFYDPEGAGSVLLRNVGVMFYLRPRHNIQNDDTLGSLTSMLQTVAPQFLITSAGVARVANQQRVLLLISFIRCQEAESAVSEKYLEETQSVRANVTSENLLGIQKSPFAGSLNFSHCSD